MDGLGIGSLMFGRAVALHLSPIGRLTPGLGQALVTLAAVSQQGPLVDYSLNASHSRDEVRQLATSPVRAHRAEEFVSATLAAEGKLSRHQLKELTTSVMANPDKRALILSMADGASGCHHTETESKMTCPTSQQSRTWNCGRSRVQLC